MVPRLPPTTDRLLDPDAIPYFLWDLGLTVAETHRVLAGLDTKQKDDLVARILREANSRDVWLFLDWPTIEEAWPRIEHRLGRAGAVWRLMRAHRRERLGEASAR